MKTPYWTRVCNRAIERKREGKEPFTEAQKKRAAAWVTCACGKQSALIPRDFAGEPLDGILTFFGRQFDTAVDAGKPGKAKRILAKIERQSLIVIAEQVTK